MIFVDIYPNEVYITIFENFTEEQYNDKEFKCSPYFPKKSITRRKGYGNFKLDTSPKMNELCIKNEFSIKITNSTSFEEIGEFINKKIENKITQI